MGFHGKCDAKHLNACAGKYVLYGQDTGTL